MNSKPQDFDFLIIGGGPAGMSAALWCAELDLTCCLFETGDEIGGQLHQIYNPIHNYLGAAFANGEQCLERFRTSLHGRRFELRSNTPVTSLDTSTMSISTQCGETFSGKAIVIATGVRRRRLGAAGEMEYRGRGLLDSGARDPRQVRGHRVAVIGGGDAALENALILSQHAEQVYLIHRRSTFSAREEFVSGVRNNATIDTILESTIEQFGGREELAFVEFRDESGSVSRLSVSRAIVRIGSQPNSEFLSEKVDTDKQGYITVDSHGLTSAKGVYAIGDVACKVSPTISSAVGSSATAVKAAADAMRKRE